MPSIHTSRPGRGAPGSTELELALDWCRRQPLPLVGVGHQWGPLRPRVREPSADAPQPDELDADLRRVAQQRWASAQLWYPRSITAENVEEVELRTIRWRPETRRGKPAMKWHAVRSKAMCMWASNAFRLGGWQKQKVRSELLQGTGDDRRRTATACITLGDDLWHRCGAWPWAAVPADGLDTWWEDETVWQRLSEWFGDLAPSWLD